MAALLSEFLAAGARRQWALGRWDCAMAVADWVRERTGRDPAEGWRGIYSDEMTRLALLRREGGLLAMMRRGLGERAGLAETGRPRPGDVGLVEYQNHRFASILSGAGWWTPIPAGGIFVARPPLLSAEVVWRVP